jgi:hypothetical protein
MALILLVLLLAILFGGLGFLLGYGNYGHRFGDVLSKADRKAVIEYLKTL